MKIITLISFDDFTDSSQLDALYSDNVTDRNRPLIFDIL